MRGGQPEEDLPSEVCSATFTRGTALLDYANCNVGDRTVGACGADYDLLRPCDSHFLEWCNDLGGDLDACAREDLRVTRFECNSMSRGHAPCDLEFENACDEYDFTFIAAGPLMGECVAEPNPANLSCCNLGNEALGDYDWQCTCDGTGYPHAGIECGLYLLSSYYSCAGDLYSPVIVCEGDYGFGDGASCN